MSKSLGNVVNPQDITRGRYKLPALGVDVLRWWVNAHSIQHMNIAVSPSTLSNSEESVKKLRNLFKFLLGSIQDLPREALDEPQRLSYLDEYMLHAIHQFSDKLTSYYESYLFHKVTTTVVNFAANEVSSFYVSLLKDRLYCDEVDSPRRRSAQFVLCHTLAVLLRGIAPMLPLLAEEVFLHHPHNEEKTPFFRATTPFPIPVESLHQWPEVSKTIELLELIKEKLEKDRPINLNSHQLHCRVFLSHDQMTLVKNLQEENISMYSDLTDICQVSTVEIVPNGDDLRVESKRTANHLCERCRRYVSLSEGALCHRCEGAVARFNINNNL